MTPVCGIYGGVTSLKIPGKIQTCGCFNLLSILFFRVFVGGSTNYFFLMQGITNKECIMEILIYVCGTHLSSLFDQIFDLIKGL